MAITLPTGVYRNESRFHTLTDGFARSLVLLAIVAPFLAVIYAAFQLWDKGIGWHQLLLLFGTYIPIAWLGVTLGLHRYFTHRGFKATPFIYVLLVFLAEVAVQGPIRKWVAEHNRHHKLSDGPGDPHSPKKFSDRSREQDSPMEQLRGLVWAHFGWLFSGERTDPAIYAKHLYKDRFIIFMDRLFPLWVVVSIGVPYLLWGWDGLIWGGLVRVFFVHHITWSINSVCHLWGERRYTDVNGGLDNSRNVPILGYPSGGESYHNNHHKFPSRIQHGTQKRDDPTYWIACGLERLHLISDLRRAPVEILPLQKAA
jgi:stearoyl-CoA desaturase (delta-9 desaturase)